MCHGPTLPHRVRREHCAWTGGTFSRHRDPGAACDTRTCVLDAPLLECDTISSCRMSTFSSAFYDGQFDPVYKHANKLNKRLYTSFFPHCTQVEFTEQVWKSKSTMKVVLWCRHLGWGGMQESWGDLGSLCMPRKVCFQFVQVLSHR